jgi:enamine deaminase RidA (YjgF/YER057c/UK114 family)
VNAGVVGTRFFAGPLGRLGELQAFASSGADLVFTRGMTGHDANTGRVVRDLSELPEALRSHIPAGMVIADVPEARIRAQTLAALDHARRALEEAGSALSQLVTLRLLLRDMRDSTAAANTVKAVLDADYFDPRREALAVEQLLMWRNIRRILAATGVPFENILRQNNWLTVSMQHYVPVTRVRARLFGLGGARTAATSLPISALRMLVPIRGASPFPATRREIEVTAHAGNG